MRSNVAAFVLACAFSGAFAGEPGIPAAPAGDGASAESDHEPTHRRNRYAITPHRPNYLLPFSWSHRPNGQVFGQADGLLDPYEVKFQLSFKVAVWEQPLDLPVDLFFAYTGRSYWQAYNSAISSPFRDTNHEPEMFFRGPWPGRRAPLEDLHLRAGFSHQSNGQPLPLSRSWNRIYVGADFRHKNLFVDVVAWYRVPEDEKTGPDDARGDDNPDITDFLGNGELNLAYVWRNRNYRLSLRNNLDHDDNRGSITFALSYPLNKRLRGYVEYFAGYGETLIDYNHSNERLSLGIALSDWP